MSASSVLPATVLPRRDSCICGKEQCRLLTICFQSCNDFRGQFMMLPTTEGDRLVDLKEFKLKRTLIHLDMASPNTHKKNLICSTDNRDRRANVVSPDSSDAASAAATNNNNNNDGNNNDNSEDDNDSNNIGSTEINVRIRLNGRLKPNSSTAVLNNYELQNCRDAPTAKASAKYVANHHFQPEILQAIFPRLWAGHGRFKDIPIGWLISGDKGFDQTSVFYPHYNQILHPAFLTGGDKAQFSEKQIGWNRKACEKRYTSEVVFARFKKYGGMGQILERHSFHYVHYLWAWAHGMANFGYLPLQTPANTDYFPESKYSRK